MSKKRVVVISDPHCGHVVGLTHPDYNPSFRVGQKAVYARERTANWKFYAETIAALQPIDILFVNGDMIDGAGEAAGGTDQLTVDRNEQVEIAVKAIEECEAGKIAMTFGTAYHTGKAEDFEQTIANRVSALKLGAQDFYDVNGLVFSLKHHVGRSESPMGRFNATAKDHIWNILWAEWGEYPKAGVIIRSHVHYYSVCGGYGWMGFTTPALQGPGSKFGTRRMSGVVDFGLMSFDVESEENYSWRAHILKRKTAKINGLEL